MAILTINNAACNVVITPVNYGLLYNWYAAIDAREITSSADWIVPSITEVNTLLSYIGSSQGFNIREVGTQHWDTANGINSLAFNARGAGQRNLSGFFGSLKSYVKWWTTNEYFSSSSGRIYHTLNNGPYFGLPGGWGSASGISLRLVRTSTVLSNGETGTYTGNDGKIYRTICIGTQEWLADNLVETKYRNTDWIAGYDAGVYTPIADATWAALTTGALFSYDDDWNNV